MFCGLLPKLHGDVNGVVYINISIAVTVPLNITRVLRYTIVMMRAAMGSRPVRQLLHIGHYVAPPINVTYSCSLLWSTPRQVRTNVVGNAPAT